eukprot:TRINITY_DN3410_c0_g2_i1.p1 TRINITY_DN3410_c0_g2~~TRINITY_DN3410_c0_g2_i1.p1  ORF type:complete len:216 (+),score=48.46 TRINITY_DN3410_c0_g2_i1:75-650(+)
MALYGWALHYGVGIRKNRVRGAQLLQQSKHVIARRYCTLYEIDYEDDEETYRLLSTQCDTLDPHVQYLLGECYRWGDGCTKDDAQAVQCYERAGNHIDALINLYSILSAYSNADDHRRAIVLLRHAATQGHAAAQHRLGFRYEHGIFRVLEKDIEQAKHWYSLAAEQGNEMAVKALKRLIAEQRGKTQRTN